MYDHIGLRVKDIEVSKRFYRATLEALGLVQDPSGAAFGPPGAPALWLHAHEGEKREKPGGAHIAFRAKSRAAVERFHASGLQAGGEDNGKPGLRPDYSPCYFAAFLIDPDILEIGAAGNDPARWASWYRNRFCCAPTE